jgi:uncharacterized protein YndB with AHSA1/START domain
MERTLQCESLLLTRFYAVAPEKVWRAWTEPDALRIWFGQADSPVWAAEMDVRPGGAYRLMLREPNGAHYAVHGVYRDLVPHRRLVFTWDQRGSPFDGEALVTVELRPTAGGTELTFTLDPVLDPRAPDAWRGDFRRLGHLLQQTD